MKNATMGKHYKVPFEFRGYNAGTFTHMRYTAMMCYTLFVVVISPAFADTNNLMKSVFAFPDIAVSAYRPDIATQVANKFIAANRSDAVAVLKEVAILGRMQSARYDVDQKICHLCRLIFVARNSSSHLRAPMLGINGLMPHGLQPSEWPYFPFAIVDEVPLSMTDGYMLFGQAEPAQDYLDYCISNGVFRVRLYPAPTVFAASNALEKCFSSAAWHSLKWDDCGQNRSHEDQVKQSLRKQIDNMRDP